MREWHQQCSEAIAREGEAVGSVVHCDLTGYPFHRFPKFAPYTLFPDALFAVVVIGTFGGIKVSVGSNAWKPTENAPNLATMCEKHGGNGQRESRPETVLVVARDGGFRRKIVEVLDGDGYAMIEAGDARQARRVWEEHDGTIDLILTTIRLASSPRRHGDLPLRRAGTRVVYVLEPDGGPMATFELEYGDLVLASGFTAYELRAMVRGALDAFVASVFDPGSMTGS